jgi:hypothetical protein
MLSYIELENVINERRRNDNFDEKQERYFDSLYEQCCMEAMLINLDPNHFKFLGA